MKLENQVCSLEQAKRLKELGIFQNSMLYHYQQFLNGVESFEIYPMQYQEYGSLVQDESLESALFYGSKNEIYSAFTVAELLLMNGELITLNEAQLQESAIAVADHLIGRLERGDITAEEVHQRLQAA